MKISREKIEQVSSNLSELPVKKKKTLNLKEVVYQLRHQLNKALKRGYSYEELVEHLQQSEIGISPETLKYYLSKANNRNKGKSKKKKRQQPQIQPVKDIRSDAGIESTVEPPQKSKSEPKAKRQSQLEPVAVRGRSKNSFVQMPDEL